MDKLKRIKIFRKKDKYELYLDDLLKTVKQKGILVETMPKGTKFLFDTRKEYKKQLGAVPVKNNFGNVTNVYVVYEDFDGSIKYYDYPEYSKKEHNIEKSYKLYKKKACVSLALAFYIMVLSLYTHIYILPLPYWHWMFKSIFFIGTLCMFYGIYCIFRFERM